MKQEQLYNIATNVEDFRTSTGFQLEFTVGDEYSVITEVQGNVEYYMDELEAVRMEKYEYFSASLMCVINQSQLRKGYIQNKLKGTNQKSIAYATRGTSNTKRATDKLFEDFMNKPDKEL